MKKSLIHGIVFNKDELEDILFDDIPSDNAKVWDILTSGDYVVHCLYDEDDKIMIYHDDDTHYNVKSEIEAFQSGLQYAGLDVKTTQVVICVEDNCCSYDIEAVKEAIENQSFSIINYIIREGR